MSSQDAMPGVPDTPGRAQLDSMVDDERADPRAELDETDFSTELGIAMAEDAKAVSRGEISSEEYWERYDGLAAEEFGDDYRETPNPAVDHGMDQTIDERTAESLACSVGSMSAVAEALDDTQASSSSSKKDGEEGDESRWG